MLKIGENTFQLDIRARLYGPEGEVVFGKGIAELLRHCHMSASLHKAAQELNMSYRKALLLVQRAEEGFGRALLCRSIGGKGGGGSTLTSFGVLLLEEYNKAEQDIADFANKRLQSLAQL